MVSKDNCKERVGEADAERRGCSHIFCSGLLARLMAVCVCVCRAHRWGYARCNYTTMCMSVCLYACMRVPKQRVESVVVYSLTVSDKYTLTTGVKKLNALYALFFPWRLPFFCLLPSPLPFLFSVFFSVILSCFCSIPGGFFLFLPTPSLSPSFHL